MKVYDSIIIGGGIFGCATGYELAKLGYKVLLIEKEYLASGSTGRCIGGIRQQFSTPGTIRAAMESVRIFNQIEDEFGIAVDWHQGGYLFLAHSDFEKESYLKLIKIQKKLGLDVEFISAEDVLKIAPQLEVSDLTGGAYCPSDGQANPFLVVKGYAAGIKRLGGEILPYTEVTKINTKDRRVTSVCTHKGDKYSAPVIINAAGAWAKEVGKLVGVALLLEPERHEAIVTEEIPFRLFEPMIVDYRPSCYFQQLWATGQIIGCYTPESPVKGIMRDSSFEFTYEFPKRILRLMPKLAELKVIRQWAGWYTMTPDGNPIIGETEVKGFWILGGCCGHGFMLAPALGKCMAELIVKGTTYIPIDEFSITREFKIEEILR
ncbi:MAG: FAD-dependent oxidoreductase [bacterium]|nr:FAD-dependent oxidoreductase [bacterium]